MLEVRDELPYGIDHFGFGEVVLGKDGLELLEEGIDLGHLVTDGLLHYAKGLEARKVDLLARDVELFVGLFTSGITLEVHRWVLQGLTIDH